VSYGITPHVRGWNGRPGRRATGGWARERSAGSTAGYITQSTSIWVVMPGRSWVQCHTMSGYVLLGHGYSENPVIVRTRVIIMGRRPKWVGLLVMIAGLFLLSPDLGLADRGGHGHRGHGHRRHWHGGSRVFIRPSIVVPFGLYTRPYWDVYPYPPVVVSPPPVYVQPSPPVAAAPAPPQ
jgi:hypothetical protein